jgi:hypothetical protein
LVVALLSVALAIAASGRLASAGEKEGEGEKGGEAKGAAPSTSKDQKEYQEKNAKLNSLLMRISESEKQFTEVVEFKN